MIKITNRGLALYLVCMAIILACAALFHIGSWLVAGSMLVAILAALAVSY